MFLLIDNSNFGQISPKKPDQSNCFLAPRLKSKLISLRNVPKEFLKTR